ncbi:DUF4190 domain-containing protein [Streptomyces sp. YIM 98790]|uniref:DUF4190 domain-containing protein n=1 Tax=Streptomyces sp. YIM 98790 TaxID=2689077 RepID=UPI002442A127|nr:DUF4190 domain-containing protein [Streptomyces sp. YIM 98790]
MAEFGAAERLEQRVRPAQPGDGEAGRSPGRTAERGAGRPRRGGWAVAALVTGIPGMVLIPVSVVFGIVALVRIKKTGRRGRGMAIAGIALPAAMLVIGLGAAGLLLAAGRPMP